MHSFFKDFYSKVSFKAEYCFEFLIHYYGGIMKQLKTIFAITATLIGAGFASGQEINTFFYIYGTKGLVGLAVCFVLFSAIIFKVLIIIEVNSIKNYKDFIFFLVGKNGFMINLIVNLFMLITFFVMIAGFGAYFSQEIGISTYVGSGILACLCFFTFMTNTNGVIKVSGLLIPILIFFIVLIGFINFSSLNRNLVLSILNSKNPNNLGWLLNSILYSSYNSILLIPVLITFGKEIRSKKDIRIISILSGMILFILAILIFFMLTKISVDITKIEMPIIFVIRHFYKQFIHIYAFIILASIYTTAISIGIGFLENFTTSSKLEMIYPLIALVMCITGFLISGFGFSNLVAILYTFFGYLGIVQIVLLFLSSP